MVKPRLKIEIGMILLASFLASAPLFGQNAPGTQAPATAASDASLSTLLAHVQATARQSDADLARLRIDRWKTDSASKQQAQATAESIHRNLVAAVPDLVQRIEAAPGSVAANFRLYRDLNVLYETFSGLTESAGAFGPSGQYSALASDLNQLDQARQQFAARVELLAGANDAELARLRARPAAAPAKAAPVHRKVTVVDDNRPAPRRARKKHKTPPHPSSQP
jgi:hypothetical protein